MRRNSKNKEGSMNEGLRSLSRYKSNSFLQPVSDQASRVSSHQWIAKQLSVKYSKNANDTQFDRTMRFKLYEKYSSSQDYYYSNFVNGILNDQLTPGVIEWQDIITMIDIDEYLKRFYELSEYDYKIELLSEYYKFHKDIPRLFLARVAKIMNKYHDKKRKLDYFQIKKLLIEEAQKKNKKVAMNEDDNEIRLTDGEISVASKESPKEESQSDSDSDSSSKLPLFKQNENVLTDSLKNSLRREARLKVREGIGRAGIVADKSNQSNSTLNDIIYKLQRISGCGSESFSLQDPEARPWERQLATEALASQAIQDAKLSRILTEEDRGKKITPTKISLLGKSAKNVKDVNLNINLNLRVLRENNQFHTTNPSLALRSTSKQKELTGSVVSGKKTTDSKKLIKDLKSKFKKKNKPEEVKSTSKEHSADSRCIKNMISVRKMAEPDNQGSFKKHTTSHQTLPQTNLKIHNFDQIFKLGGAEYRSINLLQLKKNLPKNLDRILSRCHLDERQKTERNNESNPRERSDKKGALTARGRLDNYNKSRDQFVFTKPQSISNLHKMSLTKLNFKKKKLSLGGSAQANNTSKETSKSRNLNLVSASIYQMDHLKSFRKSVKPPPSGSNPITMIKDKYHNSISSQTIRKPTIGDSNYFQSIMNNIGNRLVASKLSLSNVALNSNQVNSMKQTFEAQTNPQNGESLNTGVSTKRSTQRSRKDKKSISVKSGGKTAYPRISFLQGSKFNKLMNQEFKKNLDHRDTESSKQNPLSHRGIRGSGSKLSSRLNLESTRKSMNAIYDKSLRTRPRTQLGDKDLTTSHNYSRSDVRPVGLGHEKQRNRKKSSGHQHKTPSLLSNIKFTK